MKDRPSGDASLYFVEVQVAQAFRGLVEPQALRRVAVVALGHQQVVGPSELTLVVAADEVLHELNLRHRGVDAPTDVLAFADETPGPFVNAPDLPRYLGDVVVSFPRAQAQAAEAEHEVSVEMQLLVVHGVLHLLGYDDVAEERRARMWQVQAEILRLLDIEPHLPTW